MRFYVWALAVLGVDQLTKFIVGSTLERGQSVPIIKGFFSITYILNPGGAFGLMPRRQGLFLLASIAVIILIIIYQQVRSPRDALANVALGLILGGAAGNLLDRLRFGEVVDWLDFQVWPVFNVADPALLFGLGLFSLYILRLDKNA